MMEKHERALQKNYESHVKNAEIVGLTPIEDGSTVEAMSWNSSIVTDVGLAFNVS